MIRRGLLLGALALAGCGFAPVYGTGGDAGALRGAVRAADPDTQAGFEFVTRLEQRLGRPAAPRYDLVWAFSDTEQALAIDGSNEITRYNVEGTLVWRLEPAGGGAPVLEGTERSFTSYSATASTISTLESERDARDRLMRILADAVVARLLAWAA